MKRVLAVLSLGLLAGASTLALAQQGGSQAEAQRAAAAARQAQLAIEAQTPKLAVTEEILPLRIPGHTIGETEGVAKNKAGHLFVYSRTGWGGSSRGGNAAKLFEFDQNNQFVKEWLPDSYGASFAHAVRVDAEQNVWVVDEGSNTVVKISKDGVWQKTFGSYGSGDGNMKIPHGITVGGGHVYVADRNNSRIQVFDMDLNFQKYITGIGQPWTVQFTPKYLYSGAGDGKIYRMD